MVDITFIELHVEDGSFSANLPFGSPTEEEGEQGDDDQEAATAAEEEGGSGRGMALLGVLVLLVVGTAAVKYLTGEDEEPEVTVEAEAESPAVAAE